MRRPRLTWPGYWLGVAAVAGALAWMTGRTFELEERERLILQESDRQQQIAGELWRLHAFVGRIVSLEAARPPSQYDARLGALSGTAIPADRAAPLSPLLHLDDPMFRLHFQVDGSDLTSPQVPEGAYAEMARLQSPELAKARSEDLDRLRRRVGAPADLREAVFSNRQPPTLNLLSLSETNGRNDNFAQIDNKYRHLNNVQQQLAAFDYVSTPAIRQGIFYSRWIDFDGSPELFFVRRVERGAPLPDLLQGIWVHWPTLRTLLLAEIADRFPDASLEPISDDETDAEDVERLVVIPAKLHAGEPALPLETPRGSSRVGLLLAWLGGALAVGAVGMLLRASVTLSERRGRFVSAVTHELRTPLTTFRLYAEMLADDMVTDPERRARYLNTLKDESDRLSRVVESVLLYSRLEEGRAGFGHEILDGEYIAAMIQDSAKPHDIEVRSTELSGSIAVAPQALEQILANLTGNALKHGAPPVLIEASEQNGQLRVVVSDAGPGVQPDQARRIFEPFARGPNTEAVPGAGLGLALARELARAFNGDVTLEEASTGARFVLSLPLRTTR